MAQLYSNMVYVKGNVCQIPIGKALVVKTLILDVGNQYIENINRFPIPSFGYNYYLKDKYIGLNHEKYFYTFQITAPIKEGKWQRNVSMLNVVLGHRIFESNNKKQTVFWELNYGYGISELEIFRHRFFGNGPAGEWRLYSKWEYVQGIGANLQYRYFPNKHLSFGLYGNYKYYPIDPIGVFSISLDAAFHFNRASAERKAQRKANLKAFFDKPFFRYTPKSS